MITIRSISTLFLLLLTFGAQSVHAQSPEASIVISANPVGDPIDGIFNVSVSVSPRATYDSPLGQSRSGSGSIPIHIELPWYVDIGSPQCVGDCVGRPEVMTGSRISAGVQDGSQSHATVLFTMTVRDNTFLAAGIHVSTGISEASIFVPIHQPLEREMVTMGQVRIVSLLRVSVPDQQYVIDFDVSLPLSGGVNVVVPEGLMIGEDTGCVDAITREPSDYGRMCDAPAFLEDHGETWIQFGLPSGDYSLRVTLYPVPGFEEGRVEISAGGRYFEAESESILLPTDFERRPET